MLKYQTGNGKFALVRLLSLGAFFRTEVGHVSGRAIDIITQTLPDFFSTGLITNIDKATGEHRPASIIPVANGKPLDLKAFSGSVNEDADHIYSPKIRLSYTPPGILPAPFPKTFKAEGMLAPLFLSSSYIACVLGLSLYLMSSVLVRHTFNVLYSDVKVVMNKVVVNTPKSGNPYTPPDTISESLGNLQKRSLREKSFFVGVTVHGTARVSGAPGEWEV